MRSLANLTSTQNVVGHRLRLDMMFAIPTNSTSSNAGLGLRSLATSGPDTKAVTTVPEPATPLMLALGTLALAGGCRRSIAGRSDR